VEAAILLRKLVGLGYEEQVLQWRLRAHLAKYNWVYPAVRSNYQYKHIMQEYQQLATLAAAQ